MSEEDIFEIVATAIDDAYNMDVTSSSYARIVLSALRAAGFAVVPVEPTAGMITDGYKAHWRGADKFEMIALAYRAMLAASREGGN